MGIDVNQIYLGDCLEVMPDIRSCSIDLILTDLPYGNTAASWDSMIPLDQLWAQYKRVIKSNGAIISTASQPFTSFLVMSNLPWFKYSMVWEKNTGTRFLDANRRPLNFHEDIVVFCEGQPTYNPQRYEGTPNHGRKHSIGEVRDIEIYRGSVKRLQSDLSGDKYPRSVIYCPTVPPNQILHSTQKPVPLYAYLMMTYSNTGDVILDNAAGSGTTAVAAIQAGREWICIEKEPAIYDIAIRRIADQAHQKFLPGVFDYSECYEVVG